jgi:AraC-like DNA-binding protein
MHHSILPQEENRAKLWREPSLFNAEFLRATYPTHKFPQHSHDEYAIGFIERGAQMFLEGRRERTIMPAGTICVINPGQVHEGGPATDGGWDYRMIYLPRSALANILGIDGQLPERALPFFDAPVIDDPELLSVMRAAHSCSESPDASWLEKSSRLMLVLRQLASRHGQGERPGFLPRAASGAVKRAREYIDSRMEANPTLNEIADAAGLSSFHLLRQFKLAVGLPPHAYLMQRRVDQARRLLLRGYPMREVAIRVGYADQAHFSREFRRFYGVAPSTIL